MLHTRLQTPRLLALSLALALLPAAPTWAQTLRARFHDILSQPDLASALEEYRALPSSVEGLAFRDTSVLTSFLGEFRAVFEPSAEDLESMGPTYTALLTSALERAPDTRLYEWDLVPMVHIHPPDRFLAAFEAVFSHVHLGLIDFGGADGEPESAYGDRIIEALVERGISDEDLVPVVRALLVANTLGWDRTIGRADGDSLDVLWRAVPGSARLAVMRACVYEVDALPSGLELYDEDSGRVLGWIEDLYAMGDREIGHGIVYDLLAGAGNTAFRADCPGTIDVHMWAKLARVVPDPHYADLLETLAPSTDFGTRGGLAGRGGSLVRELLGTLRDRPVSEEQFARIRTALEGRLETEARYGADGREIFRAFIHGQAERALGATISGDESEGAFRFAPGDKAGVWSLDQFTAGAWTPVATACVGESTRSLGSFDWTFGWKMKRMFGFAPRGETQVTK